jgi:hypothetical protein
MRTKGRTYDIQPGQAVTISGALTLTLHKTTGAMRGSMRGHVISVGKTTVRIRASHVALSRRRASLSSVSVLPRSRVTSPGVYSVRKHTGKDDWKVTRASKPLPLGIKAVTYDMRSCPSNSMVTAFSKGMTLVKKNETYPQTPRVCTDDGYHFYEKHSELYEFVPNSWRGRSSTIILAVKPLSVIGKTWNVTDLRRRRRPGQRYDLKVVTRDLLILHAIGVGEGPVNAWAAIHSVKGRGLVGPGSEVHGFLKKPTLDSFARMMTSDHFADRAVREEMLRDRPVAADLPTMPTAHNRAALKYYVDATLPIHIETHIETALKNVSKNKR